jgi:hypothetical protein
VKMWLSVRSTERSTVSLEVLPLQLLSRLTIEQFRTMWVLTFTSSELSCLCNDPSPQLTVTCTPLHEGIDHSGHAFSFTRRATQEQAIWCGKKEMIGSSCCR